MYTRHVHARCPQKREGADLEPQVAVSSCVGTGKPIWILYKSNSVLTTEPALQPCQYTYLL